MGGQQKSVLEYVESTLCHCSAPKFHQREVELGPCSLRSLHLLVLLLKVKLLIVVHLSNTDSLVYAGQGSDVGKNHPFSHRGCLCDQQVSHSLVS